MLEALQLSSQQCYPLVVKIQSRPYRRLTPHLTVPCHDNVELVQMSVLLHLDVQCRPGHQTANWHCQAAQDHQDSESGAKPGVGQFVQMETLASQSSGGCYQSVRDSEPEEGHQQEGFQEAHHHRPSLSLSLGWGQNGLEQPQYDNFPDVHYSQRTMGSSVATYSHDQA
ncbi:hypothetical protein FOIG_05334 [Fusarium odoratissimum NRRL 54006]|uniref:Uncharacterized protein n=1 Tax=Fusarium odoratissimum (strain NRRL 54006) TaxID=1089451 RepID=X0JQZ3_FUSO5|nr:uncharacterized protein FOIG_05334 [Fusarium odoratissimum NRRL 54006]XP_031065727.1 uncharacterized protein FOIG_05334 [Fusarium odoratissimum NRRL 54006]EXM03637.1 hypothetical protein FOIG_05334 [Fusarium odoratissimum NRRL 54006]EXM03638.1 hypothetical protein FOIG_05334 [Fusarium odoratissimum NRRL 54006]